jgi:hypothetical protein
VLAVRPGDAERRRNVAGFERFEAQWDRHVAPLRRARRGVTGRIGVVGRGSPRTNQSCRGRERDRAGGITGSVSGVNDSRAADLTEHR